jgi:hypothetical protein
LGSHCIRLAVSTTTIAPHLEGARTLGSTPVDTAVRYDHYIHLEGEGRWAAAPVLELAVSTTTGIHLEGGTLGSRTSAQTGSPPRPLWHTS